MVLRRSLLLLGVVFALVATACSGGATDTSASGGEVNLGTAELPDQSPVEVKGTMTVYASPTCGCCHEYIPYLEANGYKVETVTIDDTTPIKQKYDIPEEAWSCHTGLIDGYVVEGHVPVEAIDELLDKRPKIDGIALPGMPAGSPGMNGTKTGPFEVVAIVGQDLQPFMSV